MKLAIVGHSYAIGNAAMKYVALKQLSEHVTLRIFVPRRTASALLEFLPRKVEGLSDEDYVVCSSAFNGMPQILDPWRLGAELAHFQPDILHIEEDPYSAMGAEAIVLARLVSRRTKLTFFTWDNLGRRPGFPKGTIKRSLTAFGFNRASLVICGTHEIQQVLYERRGYRGRSVVIPQYGTENFPELAERRLAAARLAKHGDPVTIGFAGRFVPEKGLLVLRDALAMLGERPWRLLLLGAGSLQGEIEGNWKRIFGERIELQTTVPRADVPKYLCRMDMYISHSLSTPTWKEQFGGSLAEAMMMGCVCVGSNSGSIPEVIAGAGMVTPEGDAEKLAAALATLIDRPDKRLSLSIAARRHALSHFTFDVLARSHFTSFKEVLDG